MTWCYGHKKLLLLNDISTLLLFCCFHTAQAWKNRVNHKICVIPKRPACKEVQHTITKYLTILLKDIISSRML